MGNTDPYTIRIYITDANNEQSIRMYLRSFTVSRLAKK